MKSTDFSPQFSEVWGEDASSGTITYPIPSTTTTSGRASLGAGFTSVNMTPIAAGGIPPFGQDFNGILKMLSTSAQNYEAGNVPVWSSDMATDISGYPEYALVQYGGTYYVSTADENITTPGATGAYWKSLFDGYATESFAEGTLYTSSSSWYQIFPSGLIIQGGRINTNSGGNLTLSFPYTFPTGVLYQSAEESNAATNWGLGKFAVMVGTSRVSTSVMQVYSTVIQVAASGDNPTLSYFGGKTVTCDWIAIGY